MTPHEQPTAMRAVVIPRFGEAEVMEVREAPMPVPADDEVLIRVTAAGVNRGDTVQRRGKYPPPPGVTDTPGLEVSGTVLACGASVQRWQPGDEVCAILAGGGYASHCVAPAGQCLSVPHGVSLLEAAALPETFCTVWNAVWDQARLAPGESLLVHGGSSGIGVTAIQLAVALGHPVFATAGNVDKCKACLALGATGAINYRAEDFVEKVLAATAGRGVDVVLDMVGGSYLPRNIACMALHGRQVSIGVQESREASINLGDMMVKRLSLIGTTLRGRSIAYKTEVCRQLEQHVWPLFRDGKLKPVIDRVFRLDEAAQAHRLMESGAHIGKILLTP